MLVRGDYTVVAKHTRLASSHCPTRLLKKPRRSLTIDSGDDSDDVFNLDAYDENYLAPTLDTTKHSHFCPKELETIASEGVPALATTTGLTCIFCV